MNSGELPVSLWLALLALFAALGIGLRQIAIPTFTPYVNLTPGFLMPLLTGMLLGPMGGLLCGIFVGMSGALWEPYLIPLIGNIALGLSTGIPSYYRHKMPARLWMMFCVGIAVFLGGFLPTFIIEVFVAGIVPFFAIITASIDAVQAGIWAVVALLLLLGVVEPSLNSYKSQRVGVKVK